LVDEIRAAIVVRPDGAVLPPLAFANALPHELRRWATGCARKTPEGNPGCVLVLADLLQDRAGDEALLFWMGSDSRVSLSVIWPGPHPAPPEKRPIFLRGSLTRDIPPAALDRMLRGDFDLTLVSVPALAIGEARIILKP
jgi:hypothetical protein